MSNLSAILSNSHNLQILAWLLENLLQTLNLFKNQITLDQKRQVSITIYMKFTNYFFQRLNFIWSEK